MIKFIEVDVTPEGRVYLEYWFTAISGLCGKMLPIVMSEGTVHALVPEGTSHTRSAQLKTGGLNEYDLDSRWLYPYIGSYLSKSSSSIFVAQDIWADAGYTDASCQFQFTSADGKSVYYCATGPMLSSALLAEILRRTISYSVVMFLISNCRISIGNADRSHIADQLVDEVENVEEIIVQAFDDESYVIWRKKPRYAEQPLHVF